MHCIHGLLRSATISARQAQQMLLYCQAVDVTAQVAGKRKEDLDMYDRMLVVPSVALTKRLPRCVMLHPQMRVRLATQVLPPWAVQDATGIVMEIDLSARDRQRIKSSGAKDMVMESKAKVTKWAGIFWDAWATLDGIRNGEPSPGKQEVGKWEGHCK